MYPALQRVAGSDRVAQHEIAWDTGMVVRIRWGGGVKGEKCVCATLPGAAVGEVWSRPGQRSKVCGGLVGNRNRFRV